jgi:hypothetical protein
MFSNVPLNKDIDSYNAWTLQALNSTPLNKSSAYIWHSNPGPQKLYHVCIQGWKAGHLAHQMSVCLSGNIG